MTDTSRRDFMKKGFAAGLALSTSGAVTRKTYAAVTSANSRIVFRDLGSTGFKASEMGFGVLHITDTSLLHAAIDSGINYFDTAHSYMNGKCEETLGEVLKTRRDEVFVTTKIGRGDPAKMTRDFEQSLRRLKTDCVDCLLLHGAGMDSMTNDDIKSVFETAKKDGKTRFVGVSTHDNDGVPKEVATSGFWDMLTIPYNYFSPPITAERIKQAREAGVAVVGMKNLITIQRPRKPYPDIRTKKMTGVSNQQALLKWALNNPYIDTVIPGISSFEHLADDIAVMGEKLTFGDREVLKKYAGDAGTIYCRGIVGCDGCLEQCPKGVNLGDLNRCLNYASGYCSEALAWENYRMLPPSSRIEQCGDCETCLVECRNGLALTDNIRRAKALFGGDVNPSAS